MSNDTDLQQLLAEMRDIQRAHFEEYRKVTRESLELQRHAVARQEEAVRFSSRIVLVILAVIVVVIGILFSLRAEYF